MTRNGRAALRAGLQDRSTPAVGSLAETLTSFGLTAFRVGHVRKGGLVLQLIEGIPNSLVSARRFINCSRTGSFEAAFGGTIAQINVTIFTARKVRKGQEDVLPDYLCQVDRALLFNRNFLGKRVQNHPLMESFQTAAAFQAELRLQTAGQNQIFPVPQDDKLILHGGLGTHRIVLSQGKEGRRQNARKLPAVRRKVTRINLEGIHG